MIEGISVQPTHIEEYRPPEATQTNYCNFSSSCVPETKDGLKHAGVPLGFLLSPFNGPRVFEERRAAPSCDQCGAVGNCYSSVEIAENGNTFTWSCVFCGTKNYRNVKRAIPEGKPLRYTICPDLTQQVVDYYDPSNQPIHYQNSALSYVYLIDGNIIASNMKIVVDGISKMLEHLPQETRIGFVLFTSVVSVFEVPAGSGFTSCEVYSGLENLSGDDLERLQSRKHRHVGSIQQWGVHLTRLFNYLVNTRKKVEDVAKKSQQQRALGVGIQVATQLVQETFGEEVDGRLESVVGGKLITILTGCPNYGPGCVQQSFSEQHEVDHLVETATNLYRKQASLAGKHNVSIDVYCIGLVNFRVRILQNLVLSNGGFVLLIKEFEDRQFVDTLCASVRRVVGRCGSVNIYCSKGINVTHVIGPAVPSASSVRQQSGPDRCVMSSVQSDYCFSIFYQISEILVYEHIYFQFVIQFINQHNQRVTRVITHRLGATSSVPKFIASLNQGAISVLLAKKFVLEARKTALIDIDTVRENLDTTVKKLHSLFTKNTELANQLSELTKSLFLLRRGPLLGPILQHADDIDYCRCLFLQAPYALCHRFIHASLIRVMIGGVQLLPLEDLALQSHYVLLLDHQTEIFIWEGSKVPEEERERLLTIANQLAEERYNDRFPRPFIMQFKERSSMARWLLCRLIPSHKDTLEQQIESFPELQQLGTVAYQQLLNKFHDTDDVSYHQYIKYVTTNNTKQIK